MESKRERKIGGEKAHKTMAREKGGKAEEHKMAETHVHVHHHHHHHGAEGGKKAPAKKK
jgi:hypothetical protein